jgi:hypothetical protein
MSSHVLSVTGVLSASSLAEGERIEVRGSFMLTVKSPNPHPTLSQTHSFALTGAGASISPSGREKGEANVALII